MGRERRIWMLILTSGRPGGNSGDGVVTGPWFCAQFAKDWIIFLGKKGCNRIDDYIWGFFDR